MQANGEQNGDPVGVALRPACASGELNGDPTDLVVSRRQSPHGYSHPSVCKPHGEPNGDLFGVAECGLHVHMVSRMVIQCMQAPR